MVIKRSIMKFLEDYTGYILAAVTALIGASWWIINNVLTNRSQVGLLEQKTDMMIKMMEEMRSDQKEMRKDIQQLMIK